jgi:hypothetical protein
MSSYSDEPVLVPPDARRDWKRWALVILALAATGIVVYIPIDRAKKDEAAHYARRGPHDGVLLPLELRGVPHTLELAWAINRFAPVLVPPPPPDMTLHLKGKFGAETLKWNAQLGAFGPTAAFIDPFGHYKVSVRLEEAGEVLWSDTVWAYGIHDSHDHAH